MFLKNTLFLSSLAFSFLALVFLHFVLELLVPSCTYRCHLPNGEPLQCPNNYYRTPLLKNVVPRGS